MYLREKEGREVFQKIRNMRNGEWREGEHEILF